MRKITNMGNQLTLMAPVLGAGVFSSILTGIYLGFKREAMVGSSSVRVWLKLGLISVRPSRSASVVVS